MSVPVSPSLTLAKSPTPLSSLTSSARRITRAQLERSTSVVSQDAWQDEAWDMFDLVGELRFLVNTLAGRLAQAKFYVGERTDDDTTQAPVATTNSTANDLLADIGTTTAGRAQLIARLAINLYIAGDGWLVGIPQGLLPEGHLGQSDTTDSLPPITSPLPDLGKEPDLELDDLDSVLLDDLEWRTMSISEVTATREGDVTLRLGQSDEEKLTVNPDSIVLVRCWDGHPRRSWEATSPVRAALPILRELVGLTMHISAQIDSRLAGAGLLVVPQSVQDGMSNGAEHPDEDGKPVPDEDTDELTEALIEAMTTPIKDRSSASALVPLVVTVPDEMVDKIHHINFSTSLDSASYEMREEAIRRLALSQDAPPELLLGTAGMNHWGAWLVREDVVTTHLEPTLALICDALTTQYLWPALIRDGMDEEQAARYVVWYDVAGLIVRPNRTSDAQALHAAGVISDEALREVSGFDESEAPVNTDKQDPAIRTALQMVGQAPSLAQDPGLEELVRAIRAIMGEPQPGGGSDTAVPTDQQQPAEGGEADGAPPQGGPQDADMEGDHP